MEKILCVIGLMACLFAISVLSLKAAKSLAKDNNHPFSQMLLGVVYYITAFVSAPVGIFAMLYAKQEKEAYKAEAAELDFRAREITNKQIKQMEEELASEARAREMKDRKIKQLEDELSFLKRRLLESRFDSSYMESANGMLVRVPEDKLDSWQAAQDRIRNSTSDVVLTEKEKLLRDMILEDIYGPDSENE